ncbi:MAG: hypothetical protein QNJ98_11950 [Planctomycetota bacterium]|nr:hypothetical protein [Planctomycetota bacterium]
MAKSDIPNGLAMQNLKYGDAAPADRDAVAARLRELGRRSEAVLLYEGRPEHPFLTEEVDWAVKEGAAYHLLSLKNLGVEVPDDAFRRCGSAAEDRGRYMDARTCYVALEDTEALQRINANLPASLRIAEKGAPATEAAE